MILTNENIATYAEDVNFQITAHSMHATCVDKAVIYVTGVFIPQFINYDRHIFIDNNSVRTYN